MRNINPKTIWTVKEKFSEYSSESEKCSLCLNENLEILEMKVIYLNVLRKYIRKYNLP